MSIEFDVADAFDRFLELNIFGSGLSSEQQFSIVFYVPQSVTLGEDSARLEAQSSVVVIADCRVTDGHV